MKLVLIQWRRAAAVLVTLMASLFFSPGQAEDIDLFVGASSGGTDKPNVLIVLDNTANWSPPFTAEKAALVTLVNSLDERFNVGLMMFAEPSGQGGYVRFAVRNMTTTNKTALANLVNGLSENGDKGSAGYLATSMNEAYLYFKAGTAYSGGTQAKRDYLTNTAGGISSTVAASGNAFTSSASTTYVSPVTSACSNNYIIYISNGDQGDNDNGGATDLLSHADGDTAQIVLSPSGSQANLADEWARFLAERADVNTSLTGTQIVRTFTIDVLPKSTGQGPGWTALLKSMATQGKGEYFAATNTNQIAGHLQTVFSEIQAVNSAFASASLPVSVNTQGTYLNQIFIGMFRPDPEAKPRWMGNLKQYQFVATYDSTSNSYVLQMGDKNGASAISASTGFIRPCATSFWTTDTLGAYWPTTYPGTTTAFGTCINPPNPVTYDLPDGEVVEKGGAGQHLRMLSSISSRTVNTCALALCSGLLDFNTTNTGLSSDLVDWAKGRDVLDEDGDSNTTEIRRSVHGDVVHSRPLAIDFGTTVDANNKHIPDVKVFYGANDGMLRAINADTANTEGAELWAFVAPERWAKLDRLKLNTSLISFPTFTGTPKDYFFDGPIGHYKSGSTTWIFPTMRRGGRTLYAFNVSTPGSPVLMWRRGCTDNLSALGSPAPVDTNCTSGWSSAIGQTWSEPKAALVSAYVDGSNNPKPVLIMGGGYDTCEDVDPATCSSTKGNRVFVIDAETGGMLKELSTDRAVAADLTLVDSNYDGTTELAYAVDTGGNIYRINLAFDTTHNWDNTSITKIASLGCDTTGATCTKSKFLYAPEVVSVNGGYSATSGYTAVLVGSGDREHPLSTNTSNGNNAFFMIQDNINNSLIGRDSLALVNNSNAATATVLTNKKGWYLDFADTKEAAVTSSVVVGGYVYFSTYTPTAAVTCGANLGTARAYSVNFLDATAPANETRFDTFIGGGLPPSPVAGIVEVNVPITNSDGTTTTSPKSLPFIIGGAGPGNAPVSPLQVHPPSIPISTKRTRIYWYLEK
ncbi:MAG: PilC/PilY family type IV pilus protein [Pseudomonadota bacterium]|nr:PilC/PilY family type IV pilus protein [Pseudomonadota bacterium]